MLRGEKNSMVSTPKVSVIIPCFNRETFIDKTIKSVFNQTYENIELICVDDGSTDTTKVILSSYKEKLNLLSNPNNENRGQSAAINLGLKHASGIYVAILDSDDLFLSDKIQKQVTFLENNPDIGLVYANGFYINEKGTKLYNIFPENHVEDNNPARMLMECHFNIPSNSLIRKTVLDRVGGFDESMRSAQDHDMGIRLMENTKVAFLDTPLWCYRRHENSQSGRHALRRWKTGLRILDKACKRYGYGFTIKRKRLAVLYFRIAQCYFEKKHYFKMAYYFVLAGLLDPMRAMKVVFRLETITSHHS